MIPALDNDEELKYVFYVGENIGAVGLWKRTPEYEFPIFQNTRGQGVFMSPDVNFGNLNKVEPTDEFYDAVRQITDSDVMEIDVEDCEWYEREFVHAVVNMAAEKGRDGIPTEVGQLVTHAEMRGAVE